mgnify:CR=1 FL=1
MDSNPPKHKKSQILKSNHDFINDFLIEHGVKENNYIIFNLDIFKKCQYNNIINEFLENSKPYYYKNKLHYLNRENITYNQFITVIRQICRHNLIPFSSKVKYHQSKYSIEYYFYITE